MFNLLQLDKTPDILKQFNYAFRSSAENRLMNQILCDSIANNSNDILRKLARSIHVAEHVVRQ
jgi:hypothetical protein